MTISNNNPQTNRPLDPNVLQRRASDPTSNIWVNASAGTGKTKVLTDRVLRLLLPQTNGTPGCTPHTILCITFTKAGANEMLLRIMKTLSHWSVLPETAADKEPSLTAALTNLLGSPPNTEQLSAARALFARVTNTPGGLKIMTIHAFCQSILGRFPIEAGISPQFTTIEESNATKLLLEAQKIIFTQAAADKGSPLANALNSIASTITEDQFLSLLTNITEERHQLQSLLKENFGHDGLYTKSCEAYNIAPGQNPETLITKACQPNVLDETTLREACEALTNAKSKTDQARGDILASFLSAAPEERTEQFDTYTKAFLTADKDIRKSLITKATLKTAGEHIEIALHKEAERLQTIHETLTAIICTAITRDLLLLTETITNTYTKLKDERGALDYADLIIKTLELLEHHASWVMYKLDQGINHILVDEAQDTNPEQWQIIETLCHEFYDHHNKSADQNAIRTLFVVGDEKQSIYSFQRAAPEEFIRMREGLRRKVTEAGQKWGDVDLNISFRSTQSVLQTVDQTFANNKAPISSRPAPVNHSSFRRGQAGHVELWPLYETEDTPEDDFWDPPIESQNIETGSSKHAKKIASTIKEWISTGKTLPSTGKPITPADIMILMRTRSKFVHQLTQELKNHNIPVSGSDRMVLNEDIAIQDIIATAEFTQCPQDDLTLACILKSPLIGMDEDTLFTLSHGRESTLWKALQDSKHTETTAYLNTLIHRAKYDRPYEFINGILNTPCPASPLSGLSAIKNRLGEDCEEPLYELLNIALEYEQNQIPSLQLFCDWFRQENKTIKRENKEANIGYIRIMTIHGSKGLQAPIVIMPDTIRSGAKRGNQADNRLLWPNKTSQSVPLWSPRKDYDHTTYKGAQAIIDQHEEQEYNRLLYVAMTRAEDELYVGGHSNKKTPHETSWYYKIKSALSDETAVEKDSNGYLRLSNPQIHEIPNPKTTSQPPHLPLSSTNTNWISEVAQDEIDKARIITPSSPEPKTSTAKADKQTQHTPSLAQKRGTLIHKMLEFLPELPHKNRQKAAEHFLSQHNELDTATKGTMIAETIATLNDPIFSCLFTSEALAEASITGHMPSGKIINGQVDRLLVTDQSVWIIDYKTGTPPKTVEKTPNKYIKQMQAYAIALKQLYPNHDLHTALLWTEGPTLMPIIVDTNEAL